MYKSFFLCLFFSWFFFSWFFVLEAELASFSSLRRSEGSTIGHVKSYTTLENIAFLSSCKNLSSFGDFRIHYLDDKNFASNVGMGYRFFSEASSLVLGINTYYDYRHVHHSHFHQYGLGVEILGKEWSFRLNGYLPIGKKKKVLSHCLLTYPGGYFIDHQRTMESLRGGNFEIEKLFSHCSLIDLHMAIGGYYYHGIRCKHHGNLFGVEYRLSLNPQRPFSLALSVTHDPVFQTQVIGQLIWSFPVKWCEEEKQRFQNVRRHEMIVTDKKCQWSFNY